MNVSQARQSNPFVFASTAGTGAGSRQAGMVNLREIPGVGFGDDDRPEVQAETKALQAEVALPPAQRCRAQVIRSWNLTTDDVAAMSPEAASGMNARIDDEVTRRMGITANRGGDGSNLSPDSIWFTYGTVQSAPTVDLLMARAAHGAR